MFLGLGGSSYIPGSWRDSVATSLSILCMTGLHGQVSTMFSHPDGLLSSGFWDKGDAHMPWKELAH